VLYQGTTGTIFITRGSTALEVSTLTIGYPGDLPHLKPALYH